MQYYAQMSLINVHADVSMLTKGLNFVSVLIHAFGAAKQVAGCADPESLVRGGPTETTFFS